MPMRMVEKCRRCDIVRVVSFPTLIVEQSEKTGLLESRIKCKRCGVEASGCGPCLEEAIRTCVSEWNGIPIHRQDYDEMWKMRDEGRI